MEYDFARSHDTWDIGDRTGGVGSHDRHLARIKPEIEGGGLPLDCAVEDAKDFAQSEGDATPILGMCLRDTVCWYLNI